MIVVDCSYTLACVMPDEQRPMALDQLITDRLLAPVIWPIEVANGLRNSLRRKRLNEGHLQAICTDIMALEIEVLAPNQQSVTQFLDAALRHDLTSYDASYLELALQHRCTLATLDNGLADAARRAGLQVLS